jgi:hypothetical protein
MKMENKIIIKNGLIFDKVQEKFRSRKKLSIRFTCLKDLIKII